MSIPLKVAKQVIKGYEPCLVLINKQINVNIGGFLPVLILWIFCQQSETTQF